MDKMDWLSPKNKKCFEVMPRRSIHQKLNSIKHRRCSPEGRRLLWGGLRSGRESLREGIRSAQGSLEETDRSGEKSKREGFLGEWIARGKPASLRTCLGEAARLGVRGTWFGKGLAGTTIYAPMWRAHMDGLYTLHVLTELQRHLK